MSLDAERIRALLGGPEYRRLFAAARGRVEEAGDGARSVTVADLDAAERKALADLVGWETIPDGAVRVDLGRLDAALRESAVGVPLVEVLEALGGPLRDIRSERRTEREGRERLWAEAREAIAAAARPELAGWLDALRSSGALSRSARACGQPEGPLLEAAVRVALRLPARGELLSVFAASAAGDPHALDAGAPLGALVLRAAAAMTGRAEVPATAHARRRIWREVGVDCDSLSADVLVLGVRPAGDDRLARQLRESAADGEPRRVTLRELRRAGLDERSRSGAHELLRLALPSGVPVYVCENPAVVEAAADAGGARCAALVCVEGVPSTAAMVLLRALAAAGARVRAHADFDWAGLRIAGQVIAETGGEPWRFSSEDYAAAVAAGRGGPPLAGGAATAPWDERLPAAMRDAGVSVPEEAVLGELLGGLIREGR